MSKKSAENKTAVVVGSAGDIGKAIVSRLTLDGYRVIGWQRKPGDGESETVAVDLANPESISAAAHVTLSMSPEIDTVVYAAGFPESLAYATSTSVTGPWQYQGIIMDPLPNTTTIHPAMFDFNGHTYLAYHSADLPGGGNYRRSVSLDRVYFYPDGSIEKIIRTTKP